MGSFLKIQKYRSKQYGSISENWTHIGLSKYGLKNYLCPRCAGAPWGPGIPGGLRAHNPLVPLVAGAYVTLLL